ncbi:MAG: hypothetical protein U0Y68_15525 [Blastocatellia bacterium]
MVALLVAGFTQLLQPLPAHSPKEVGKLIFQQIAMKNRMHRVLEFCPPIHQRAPITKEMA